MQAIQPDKILIVVSALFILGALSMGPYKLQDAVSAPILTATSMEKAPSEPTTSTTTAGPKAQNSRVAAITPAGSNGSESNPSNRAEVNETGGKVAGFRSLPAPMSGGYDVPGQMSRRANRSANSSGPNGTPIATVPALTQGPDTNKTTSTTFEQTTSTTIIDVPDSLKDGCDNESCKTFASEDGTSTSTTRMRVTPTTCPSENEVSTTTTTGPAEGTAKTTSYTQTAPEFTSVGLVIAMLLLAPALAFLMVKKRG